jgi:hypothetical protein
MFHPRWRWAVGGRLHQLEIEEKGRKLFLTLTLQDTTAIEAMMMDTI